MASARAQASARKEILRSAVGSVVESLERRQLLASVAINFQTSGTSTPSGYLADSGAAYADRGNGYSYGWNADNSANTANDGTIIMVDTPYKTYAKMQPSGVNRTWEIGLANGAYQVKVVAGDYQNTTSVYDVRIEGQQGPAGTADAYTHWFEKTVVANVTDGRLTITNGANASDQRIAFVQITDVASLSVPAPTASNLVARAASNNAIDLLWDDTTTNEYGFEIQRKLGSGSFATVATVGGGNEYWGFNSRAFYNDTDLTSGAVYTYRVRPVNAAGSPSTWSNEATVDLPATNAQAAYNNGVARPVTSRIEAEDFDIGGPAFGYTDNSTGNYADLYRRADVDIGTYSAGHFVGWNSADEWTAYTVSVPTSGTYDLTFARSRSVDGGTFQILQDGVAVGPQSIQILGTGSAFTFQTTTVSGFNLSAGTHVLTLKILTTPSGSAEAGNIDWLQFNLVSSGTAAPTNLAAPTVQPNSVSLTWTDNANNESSYRIERKTGTGAWSTLISGLAANTTSHTDTTVSPSTSYTYRVIAVGSTDSPASNEAAVTTPATISQQTLAPVADAYVRGGSTYDTTNYGTAAELLSKLTSTGSSTHREIFLKFDVTGLNNVTSAKLRVYGRRHTLVGTDPNPLNFNIRSVSNTSWTESGITYVNRPSTVATLGTVGLTSTTNQWFEIDITAYVQQERAAGRSLVSLGITGTYSGSDAAFYINSKEATNGPELVVQTQVVLNPPATPSALQLDGVVTPTGPSAASVPLKWTDNATNEVNYYVERKSSSGTQWAAVSGLLPANTTTFLDTTAASDETYDYRVYAVNADGSSGYATLNGISTPPTAPSGLSGTAAATAINLTWTDLADTETAYRVEYRRSNDPTDSTYHSVISAQDLGPDASSYTLPGLLEGTQYDLRVRAINSVNDGWPAGPIQPWTKLATPTNVSLTNLSSTSMRVAWTDNSAKEASYVVEYTTDSTFTTGVTTKTESANATYSDLTGLTAGATYFVRLRAANSNTVSDYWSGSNNPSGQLSITRDPGGSPNEGSSITLNAVYANGAPQGTTYTWAVTRGGQSLPGGTGSSLVFTATDNGVYEVSLNASNGDVATHSFTVVNVNPTATISGVPSGSVNEGSQINLTVAASDAGTADTFSYAWTVVKDGQAYTLPSGTTTNAASLSFVPRDNGSYVATLSVTDDDGGSFTVSTAAIAVANVAPVAGITGTPAGEPDEGDTVSATATVSDAGEDDAHTYTWSVTKNGQPYDLTGVTTDQATFAFVPDDNAGYVISLTIADDDEATHTTTSGTITVNNLPPLLTLNGDGSVVEGQTYSLTIQSVDAGDDTITSYLIDWGDGSDPDNDGQPAQLISDSSQPITHTYDSPGSYSIHVHATDEDGEYDATPKDVNVVSAMAFPIFALTGDSSATAGQPYSLQATSAGGPVTWTIAWGDGSSESVPAASTFSVSHIFEATVEQGTVQVTAQSVTGLSSSQTKSVAISGTTASSPPQMLTLQATPLINWTSSGGASPVEYVIKRDGILVGRTPAKSFYDYDQRPGTTYQYTVQAVDANGVQSNSLAVSMTSSADQGSPLVSPSARIVSASNTSATVEWDAASDDVSIDHYEVRGYSKLSTEDQEAYFVTNTTVGGSETTAQLNFSSGDKVRYVKVVVGAGNGSNSTITAPTIDERRTVIQNQYVPTSLTDYFYNDVLRSLRGRIAQAGAADSIFAKVGHGFEHWLDLPDSGAPNPIGSSSNKNDDFVFLDSGSAVPNATTAALPKMNAIRFHDANENLRKDSGEPVWYDANGDSSFDPGEPTLENGSQLQEDDFGLNAGWRYADFNRNGSFDLGEQFSESLPAIGSASGTSQQEYAWRPTDTGSQYYWSGQPIWHDADQDRVYDAGERVIYGSGLAVGDYGRTTGLNYSNLGGNASKRIVWADRDPDHAVYFSQPSPTSTASGRVRFELEGAKALVRALAPYFQQKDATQSTPLDEVEVLRTVNVAAHTLPLNLTPLLPASGVNYGFDFTWNWDGSDSTRLFVGDCFEIGTSWYRVESIDGSKVTLSGQQPLTTATSGNVEVRNWTATPQRSAITSTIASEPALSYTRGVPAGVFESTFSELAGATSAFDLTLAEFSLQQNSIAFSPTTIPPVGTVPAAKVSTLTENALFNEVPDSDDDELVRVSGSFAQSTGSIEWQLDRETAQTILPLAVISPRRKLPVTPYLSIGGFDSSSHSLYATPTTYGSSTKMAQEGSLFADSRDTRFVESFLINDGLNHIKRVTAVRPKGNHVTFDFAWDATSQTFSSNGYPIGINSGRTYVLHAQGPDQNTYRLDFTNGISHRQDSSGNFWVEDHQQRVFNVKNGEPIFGADVNWSNGEIASLAYDFNRNTTGFASGTGPVVTTEITRSGRQVSGLTKKVNGVAAPQLSYALAGNEISWNTNKITREGSVASQSVKLKSTRSDGTWQQTETLFNTLRMPTTMVVTGSDVTESASTSIIYAQPLSTERYPSNGLLKRTSIARINSADESWTEFDHDPLSGWVTEQRSPFNGNSATAITSFSYDVANVWRTLPADTSRFTARPTKIEQSVKRTIGEVTDEILVSRRLVRESDSTAGTYTVADATTSLLASQNADWYFIPFKSTITPGQYWGVTGGVQTPAERIYASANTSSVASMNVEMGGVLLERTTQWFTYSGHTARADVARWTSANAYLGQKTLFAGTSDRLGRVVSRTYAGGETETASFDATNGSEYWFGPSSVTTGTGGTTTLDYTQWGAIQAFSSRGVETNLQYDARGATKAATTVGAFGGSAAVTSATSSASDHLGRLTAHTNPLAKLTSISYSTTGGIVSSTSTYAGNTTIVNATIDGLLKQVSGTAVPHSSYAYGIDAPYHPQAQSDNPDLPNYIGGNPEPSELAEQGGLWIETTDELGQKVKTWFNLLGQPYRQSVAVRNSDNTVGTRYRSWTYDAWNRLEKTSNIDGTETVYRYDYTGSVNAVEQKVDGTHTTRARTRSEWVNDPSKGLVQRTFETIDGNPSATVTTETRFDGLKSWVTSPNGTTRFERSVANNGAWTTTVTNPDGTSTVETYANGVLEHVDSKDKSGTVLQRVTYGYDGLARVNSVSTTVAQVTRTTGYTLRADGSVARIDYPDGTYEQVTEWNERTDQPKKVRLRDGTIRDITTNDRGEVNKILGGTIPTVSSVNPTAGTTTLGTTRTGEDANTASNSEYDITTWNYDNVTGLLKDKTYANGAKDSFSYKGNRQLEKITRPGSTFVETDVETTFDYNAQGTLFKTTHSGGISHQITLFDSLGRARQDQYTANGQTVTNAYGYNIAQQLVSETQNHIGGSIGYEYFGADASGPGQSAGMPKQATFGVPNSPAVITGYQYDGGGRLWKVTSGDVETEYGYKADTHLVASITIRKSGAVVTTESRTYEANTDRLKKIERKDPAGNVIYSMDYTAFDSRDHHKNATVVRKQVGGSTQTQSWAWNYDLYGQLTSSTESTNNWSHSYAYDHAGNRAGRGANALNQYSDRYYDRRGNLRTAYGWSYTYNALDQVVSAESDTTKVSFAYDGQGRRVLKETFTNNAGTWELTTSRKFGYDGTQLLAEYDGTTSKLLKSYTWGLGIGQIGGLLAIRTYDTDGYVTGTYYPFYDGSGNVRGLTDASGAVVATYEYDPYGNMLSQAGAAAAVSPFLFSTMYQDQETGAYHFPYREYDPVDGRWTTRDPIAESGGLNLYAFNVNDPVNHVDPSGLEPRKLREPLSYREMADWRPDVQQLYWNRRLDLIRQRMPGDSYAAQTIWDGERSEWETEKAIYHGTANGQILAKRFNDPYGIATRVGGLSRAAFSTAGAIIVAPTAAVGWGIPAEIFLADNAAAGIAQLITGEYEPALNTQLVSYGVQRAGFSKTTGDVAGELFNMAGTAGTSWMATPTAGFQVLNVEDLGLSGGSPLLLGQPPLYGAPALRNLPTFSARQPIPFFESSVSNASALGISLNQTAQPVVASGYVFRSINWQYPANAQAMMLMDDLMSQVRAGTLDCSVVAHRLHQATGEGSILHFGYQPYSVAAFQNPVRVPAGNRLESFDFHQVYTDGMYVYDPFLSAWPVAKGDYVSLMLQLNKGTPLKVNP